MLVYDDLSIPYILVQYARLFTGYVGNFVMAFAIDSDGLMNAYVTIVVVFLVAFSMWFFVVYEYWFVYKAINNDLPQDYWDEMQRQAEIFSKEAKIEEIRRLEHAKYLQELKKKRKLAWDEYWGTYTLVVKIRKFRGRNDKKLK